MSAAIKSGVNWMRENLSSSASATLDTISVLASPGTPTGRAWPPENTAVRMPSRTSFWPTMRRPTWDNRSPRAVARRSNSSRSPDDRDAGWGMGDGGWVMKLGYVSTSYHQAPHKVAPFLLFLTLLALFFTSA